jgi:hypothetical protein
VEVWDFARYGEKLRNFETEPCRARHASEACADPGEAGVMPRSGMPGACRSGIVKNQQGLAAEVLLIDSSEGVALLNFAQYREKACGGNFAVLNFTQYRNKIKRWKFCSSGFSTIPVIN